MKTLLGGILLIIIVGIGGLVYRNAVEHPQQPITCPVDALVCPDGTSVSRVGTTCDFPACPAPNVSLVSARIAFALPAGFAATTLSDGASIATYNLAGTSTIPSSIIIRQYAIEASSTALDTIKKTAIGGTSGAPIPVTAFTSVTLGTHRYTMVTIDRFEGVIDIAYYLGRGTDVLRFDAIDRDALNWMDPKLDVTTLPANAALRKLLTTLQGE